MIYHFLDSCIVFHYSLDYYRYYENSKYLIANSNSFISTRLVQEINNKLKPKFEKELKPGTRVVSHVFTFDGWKPSKVDRDSQVYLYLI